MASPHFYLTRRCVLDATAPHRTSCWFPAQRGATGVLQLSDRSRLSHGGLNRLRLESVYTLQLRCGFDGAREARVLRAEFILKVMILLYLT